MKFLSVLFIGFIFLGSLLARAEQTQPESLIEIFDQEFRTAPNMDQDYKALKHIEVALSQGSDPNEIDREGRTLLMKITDLCLIHSPVFEIERVNYLLKTIPNTMQQLINAGANVNAKDFVGNTALHYNVCHEEFAKTLLNNKADTGIVNHSKENALHRLIHQAANHPVYSSSKGYWSKGSQPILVMLIQNTVDLKNIDVWGGTILRDLFSISHRAYDVSYLLQILMFQEKDLGFDLVDNKNRNAFDLAIDYMDPPAPRTEIPRTRQLPESVLLRIAQKTTPRVSGPDGLVLNKVITKNLSKVFQYLLGKGLDPKLKNQDGKNSLIQAILQQNSIFSNIALDLIQRVDVNDVDSRGANAFFYTVMTENQEVASSILNQIPMSSRKTYVNIPAPGFNGALPIHIAAVNANYNIVHWLISLGAAVNGKDYYGVTPIMSAAASNRSELPGSDVSILAELMNHEGCIDSINHNGDTALSIATKSKKESFVTVLQVAMSEHRNLCCSVR